MVPHSELDMKVDQLMISDFRSDSSSSKDGMRELLSQLLSFMLLHIHS